MPMFRPRSLTSISSFFFTDPPTTEIYTLSLHDALPICPGVPGPAPGPGHPAERDPSGDPWRQCAHGVVLSLAEGRGGARRAVRDRAAAAARAATLFSLLQSPAAAFRLGVSRPS